MWRELFGMERLSHFELRVLREACEALEHPMKAIATRQLNSIRSIRHKPRRMGAYIYLRESAPSLIGAMPHDFSDENEFILAEVRSTRADVGLSITTRIWCVTGTIFELAHEARGRAFLEAIKEKDVTYLDFTVKTLPQLKRSIRP